MVKPSCADDYFLNGCGRCPKGGTPDCKVNLWKKPLAALRNLLLQCGLHETVKWGHPCYTHAGKNIALLASFNDHCTLSFFKGHLLQDKFGMLQKPGKNTRYASVINFKNEQDVVLKSAQVCYYIQEAIALEMKGEKTVITGDDHLAIPKELIEILNSNQEVKDAFYQLTPGRRRGYILYFSAPVKSATKVKRIQKCIPKILSLKGLYD
ncbi:MAG: YdeI/OmpD-associated family protein [Chitinophagales bacterium]|nr:YdeI/OmpD-associated family protein [Chitinophagales bacterium]MDW8418193.1 YdeI/OmpD-associated family protein [Chitinophagales bacterium]